ncbi:MAG: hypothetical protein AAF609_16615 [Cyanobacteria bacterium P01_C01_bin.120]
MTEINHSKQKNLRVDKTLKPNKSELQEKPDKSESQEKLDERPSVTEDVFIHCISKIHGDLENLHKDLKDFKKEAKDGDAIGLFFYVVVPSFIGGAGKISLEMLNTSSPETQTVIPRRIEEQFKLEGSSAAIAYIVLNMIVALAVGFLGTVLVGEVPSRKSSGRWKTAGLALSYALFFPLAINVISENIFLEDELDKTTIETAQNQGSTLNNIVNNVDDSNQVSLIIGDLGSLATETENMETKRYVIRTLAGVLLSDKVNEVSKEEAIQYVEDIASSSNSQEILRQAISAMDSFLEEQNISEDLRSKATEAKANLEQLKQE